MPSNFIKDVHKQTGESTKKLDTEFKTVENAAKKEKGVTNPYAVATAAVIKYSHYKPKGK
jgi:hypothetical protein